MGTTAGLALYLFGVLGIFPGGREVRRRVRGLLRGDGAGAVLGPVHRRAAGGAGRAVHRTRSRRVWVALLFVGLQQLEGHIVAPQIFGHTLRINPLLVIFALLLGLQVQGLLGALIALPILSVLRETAVYLAPARRPGTLGATGPTACCERSPAGAGPGQAATASSGRCRTSASQAAAGEVVAIVGPNGAGKTTLLSIIAGLQRSDRGLGRTPAQARWAGRRSRPRSTRKLSVGENLGCSPSSSACRTRAPPSSGCSTRRGCASASDERVGNLSGGNRQRVNVALALIAGPPVLALDEPSAALDPGQRGRLWEFIAGLAAGGTSVLFSTHNVGEVTRHADRMLILADGRLLFDGPPATLPVPAPEGDLELAVIAFLRSEGASPEGEPSEVAAGQGPADPAPLAAAARAARHLSDRDLAADRLRDLAQPGKAARRDRRRNACPGRPSASATGM